MRADRVLRFGWSNLRQAKENTANVIWQLQNGAINSELQ